MIDDYMLDKVLDKIKEILGIGKFNDTKILIVIDYKRPDDITLKNFVILMTYVIKYYDRLYLQLFLEEALYDE